MLCLRLLIPAVLAVGYLTVCRPMTASASPEVTMRAARFVKDHETRLRPLEVASSLAWWTANTTGKDGGLRQEGRDPERHRCRTRRPQGLR